MRLPQITRETVSIVLVGSFNPKIFHPMWFAAHELIRRTEAEDAKVQLVHPEISQWATDAFSCQVSQDSFRLVSSGNAFKGALRDLVVSTFTVLKHTPIRIMGINREFEFLVDDEDLWHKVGHTVSPKAVWGAALKDAGTEEVRLRSKRTDSHAGFVRTILRPSENVHQGVYIQVNDHYVLQGDDATGAQPAIELLKEQWQRSLDEAQKIVETLFSNI